MTKTEFRTECERRRDEGLMLTGNTYPIRAQIKRLGGIWDAREKGWLMPGPDAFRQAAAAMTGGGSRTSRPRRSRGVPRTERCRACGGDGSVEAELGTCERCWNEFD